MKAYLKSQKIIVLITFLLMVGFNGLANTIPINGVTTGAVSDKYRNLFAPDPITFIIWGLIYSLLLIYTIYQIIAIKNHGGSENKELLKKINIWFIVSSLANAIWIVAWHYELILFSLILIIIVIVSLIMINWLLRKQPLDLKEKIMVKLPFSVYFGWMTVATVANVTTFLVSIGWSGFGLSEPLWTVIVLLVALLITGMTILFNGDIAYGLVIIWAYIGILIKHVSATGFNGRHQGVIITLVICLAILLAVNGYVLINRKKRQIGVENP